ncbi:hypothetical protein BZG36_02752 [Bifiguratus adelaidae]|uniref:PHD-type domain-containing protein n=1 Tax=Bifiguratus adelaidae TaxID=1938954 RepID=A0A261XYQ5_9FUNG|nr:hypothetical protein BZG36_02752 [Bifiguratus adelaidae]
MSLVSAQMSKRQDAQDDLEEIIPKLPSKELDGTRQEYVDGDVKYEYTCHPVGECEPCSDLEKKIQTYCRPYGNKQLIQCSWMGPEPPSRVELPTHQPCRRVAKIEMQAFNVAIAVLRGWRVELACNLDHGMALDTIPAIILLRLLLQLVPLPTRVVVNTQWHYILAFQLAFLGSSTDLSGFLTRSLRKAYSDAQVEWVDTWRSVTIGSSADWHTVNACLMGDDQEDTPSGIQVQVSPEARSSIRKQFTCINPEYRKQEKMLQRKTSIERDGFLYDASVVLKGALQYMTEKTAGSLNGTLASGRMPDGFDPAMLDKFKHLIQQTQGRVSSGAESMRERLEKTTRHLVYDLSAVLLRRKEDTGNQHPWLLLMKIYPDGPLQDQSYQWRAEFGVEADALMNLDTDALLADEDVIQAMRAWRDPEPLSPLPHHSVSSHTSTNPTPTSIAQTLYAQIKDHYVPWYLFYTKFGASEEDETPVSEQQLTHLDSDAQMHSENSMLDGQHGFADTDMDEGWIDSGGWVDAPRYDDIVACKTCHNGDEATGNQIFLCDKCDEGVHQLCAVPPIRDEEIEQDPWYCRECQSKNTDIAMDGISGVKRKIDETDS